MSTNQRNTLASAGAILVSAIALCAFERIDGGNFVTICFIVGGMATGLNVASAAIKRKVEQITGQQIG